MTKKNVARRASAKKTKVAIAKKATAPQKKTSAFTKAELKKLDTRVNNSFSENAERMMKKRYLAKRANGTQETPAELFHRVSRGLAAIERRYGKSEQEVAKLESDFFSVMANKEFTPAGRTLTNVGAGTPIIASCIVMPVHDTLEDIFQTLKESALLQQAGCGLGFSFSRLRPAGTPTKRTNGMSSGPIEFLRIYNAAFGIIKQQGRHGANMGIMRVDHPDILDFMKSKNKEGDIRNFNISVGITDEFMNAVTKKPNEPWLATFNGKKMKPRKILRAGNGSVLGYEELDITAKEIFDELVEGAWKNGEPGVVNLDEANRTNPLPKLGDIDATNPCVTGDTLIPTEKGLLTIEDIAISYPNGQINIATDARAYDILERNPAKGALATKVKAVCVINTATKVWMSGIKPVYRLVTHSGYELTATADHKILTTEGKVEISKLTQDHKVLIQPGQGVWSTNDRLPFAVSNMVLGKNGREYSNNLPKRWSKELGQVLGWLIGDGWFRDKIKQETIGFTFSKDDQTIMDYLKPILNHWSGYDIQEIERDNGVYHLMYHAKPFNQFFAALGVNPVRADHKSVPQALFTAPKEAVVGFLQGIFSADGTIANDDVKGNRYVRLTAKSEKMLKQIQILLLNLGIKSRIYDRSRAPRETFAYTTKAGENKVYVSGGILFELQINKEGLEKFISQIGFLADKHAGKINSLTNHSYRKQNFLEKIKSIEYVGEEKVYDLSEPSTTTFIANGLVISNCGEQFLHHYDVCNLGSINLSAFVEGKKINWTRLRHATRTAVRALDNVIDLYDHPVKKVDERAQANRRIGLGVMGFADMLFKLRVPYNSKEGRDLAEKTMGFVNKEAHKASQDLAKEKGEFANFKDSIFARGKKMRNAALTTVAPTGSISMFTDCSSGIEPEFALSFTKQDKDGEQYQYLNPLLKIALEEAKIDIEGSGIKEELAKTGSIQGLMNLPESLRKTFVVSMDISAEDHVKMQAAFQKYTDNSISKTINFPNSATREDIAEGYIMAWKMRCKGMTFYRDGSRQIEAISIGDKEMKSITSSLDEKQEVVEAKEAPMNLPIDQGKISPRIRPDVVSGRTYKVKTGYGNLYVTINNDESGAPLEVFATLGKSGGYFQEQSEGLCRLISTALRSRIKVEEIIKELKGIRGPMPVMTNRGTILSLPDAIAQVMEEHVSGPSLTSEQAMAPELVQAPVKTNEAGQQTQPIKSRSLADFGMMPQCPDCGGNLVLQEGCMACKNCGFSRCS